MIVYLFDKSTGEYIKEYSPQINPKRPQEYITPPNTTQIEPPKPEKGYVYIFDAQKWNKMEDYRGQEIINLDTKEISKMSIIASIPENYMLMEHYKYTDEYFEEEKAKVINQKKQEIFAQIAEIDLKRIRAICEPDTQDNSHYWLQKYTDQIVELRKKIQEL